jgi:hypothetical protein
MKIFFSVWWKYFFLCDENIFFIARDEKSGHFWPPQRGGRGGGHFWTFWTPRKPLVAKCRLFCHVGGSKNGHFWGSKKWPKTVKNGQKRPFSLQNALSSFLACFYTYSKFGKFCIIFESGARTLPNPTPMRCRPYLRVFIIIFWVCLILHIFLGVLNFLRA